MVVGLVVAVVFGGGVEVAGVVVMVMGRWMLGMGGCFGDVWGFGVVVVVVVVGVVESRFCFWFFNWLVWIAEEGEEEEEDGEGGL